METIIGVDGMTCGGCAASVTKALAKAGIPAKVDLESRTATLPPDADLSAARRAVEGAGFDYRPPATPAQP